jgi:thiol-disulfide isomerase/thioredoxin
MRGTLAVVLLALLGGCGAADSGDKVADFPALGGNWIIVNYWATWCAPCREEIPELNLLAVRSSDIDVYAVDFDGHEGEELLAQAADMGIEFRLLARDPGERLGLTRPHALPTTVILSPEGREVMRLIGPQTEQSLRRELAFARETASSPEK